MNVESVWIGSSTLARFGGDSPDVGPNILWSAVSGAKAPKVVIPMIASELSTSGSTRTSQSMTL